LLEGRKRWLLFPPGQVPLLYPSWAEGRNEAVFAVDPSKPDLDRFPAARLATGWACTLEAGDLLFVPAGSPHQVENLTDTLAVSSNYVDATNLPKALHALEEQAHTDQGAKDLLLALQGCE
ncbi:unnamed protein product, partial [Discosporangium mesarthrocarpum]